MVSTILASRGTTSDAEDDALGVAVVGADTTHGAWGYSTDGENSWTAFESLSDSAAVLLAGDDSVRFVPNAGFNGAGGSVSVRAWGGSAGTAGTTADTTINGGTTASSTTTVSTGATVTAVDDCDAHRVANSDVDCQRDHDLDAYRNVGAGGNYHQCARGRGCGGSDFTDRSAPSRYATPAVTRPNRRISLSSDLDRDRIAEQFRGA